MLNQWAKSTVASNTDIFKLCPYLLNWFPQIELNTVLCGAKRRTDFMWGANRNLWFWTGIVKWTCRNRPHLQYIFFLIKEHIQPVSVQLLPTHSHPVATLWKFLSLPRIQDLGVWAESKSRVFRRPFNKRLGALPLKPCSQNPFLGSHKTWGDTLGFIWA